MELQNNNINDNIINMNDSVNNELNCISVKSKKEPDKRCTCKKKILNGVLQSYCGKHIKSNNKIVFGVGNTIVKQKTGKVVNRRLYTLTSLPICIDCNIIQLCDSLDFYSIPYVRREKFIVLYNKLKAKLSLYEEYRENVNHIIVIQKNMRKNLILKNLINLLVMLMNIENLKIMLINFIKIKNMMKVNLSIMEQTK